MPSPFSKPSEFGGGGAYFEPKNHMTDLALMIEPHSIERQVPNNYQNTVRHRDEVLADIAVFANSEALETGTPTKVLSRVKVTHGMLTSTLERVIGGVIVAKVEKISTKNGSGYVFRDVDDATENAVAGYWEAREALEADAPSFG